jgi:hypothetical protein
MPVDYFAVASDQAWNLEAELADRSAHAIHRTVVLAGIARILAEPFDRPKMRDHTRTFQ